MCGIAGFFSPHHSYSPEMIQRMTACVAHRGPDAEGFFSDETVSFGHRRLSIIDLNATANQPMVSADGKWVLMFNGEVFNFRELAESLKIPLQTHSDTEVILEQFAAMGIEAVNKFNGMFAIALYHKTEKILYLVRDRIGVKPLFYYQSGGESFFASEIKSLTIVDEIKKQLTINRQAVSLFLQLGYIPEPFTIWNEIKKFPAGFYAKITEHEFTFQCYWKAEEKISSQVFSDPASATNQLRELLESSVRYRMISDVPFGIFLSGGIDSSLIAAIARQQSSSPVKTFTIGFREQQFDEAGHASKIAAQLKTDHHEILLRHEDALELCEPALDAFDEPFADSSAIPTMLISRHARCDVKMVLSGDGGDELFHGYGMYRWAERLHNPFVKALRSPIASSLSILSNRHKRAAELFRFKKDQNLQQHIFSQEQYFFSENETKQLLVANFINGTIPERPSMLRNLIASEKQALYDLQNYLKDDLLVKVDRATMHSGLECRTPFLDYRIVEFALNVTPSLKMKNGELKILPRLLLGEYLPNHLFDRPKQGFALPLKQWLQKELRHLIVHFLSEEIIHRHGIVRYEEVNRLKQRFSGGLDYLYNRLWNLIVLHRWLEKNMKKS